MDCLCSPIILRNRPREAVSSRKLCKVQPSRIPHGWRILTPARSMSRRRRGWDPPHYKLSGCIRIPASPRPKRNSLRIHPRHDPSAHLAGSGHKTGLFDCPLPTDLDFEYATGPSFLRSSEHEPIQLLACAGEAILLLRLNWLSELAIPGYLPL